SNLTWLLTTFETSPDLMCRMSETYTFHCNSDYCFVFNGTRLRIFDASRLYSRRFVEFDLDCLCHDERACAALFRIGAGASAALQRDSKLSLHAIVAASDRHAAAVCRSLKDGVLAASAQLLAALVAGRSRARGGG